MSYDFKQIEQLLLTGDMDNIELAITLSENFFKQFYDLFMSLQITVQRWKMHLNRWNVNNSRGYNCDNRIFDYFERKAEYKGFNFGWAAYCYCEHYKIGERSDYNLCHCGAVKGKCFIPELPAKCNGLPF